MLRRNCKSKDIFNQISKIVALVNNRCRDNSYEVVFRHRRKVTYKITDDVFLAKSSTKLESANPTPTCFCPSRSL